jgi:hypothetical protein
VLQPLPEYALTLEREQNWGDVGIHAEWLGLMLWNRVALPISCWLLVVLQSLLNAYSTMLTIWAEAINNIWRLLVAWAIWMTSAYAEFWLLAEDIRRLQAAQLAAAAQVDIYWRALLDGIQHIITMLSSMTTTYIDMLSTPIAAMRYLVALMVTSIPGMTLVISDPESYKPAPLVGIEGNMFWQMFVGGINGFVDSVGWVWAFFVACYYMVITWRVLDEAREL